MTLLGLHTQKYSVSVIESLVSKSGVNAREKLAGMATAFDKDRLNGDADRLDVYPHNWLKWDGLPQTKGDGLPKTIG